MSETPTTKVCTKCGVEKGLSEFAKDMECRLGRKNVCRKCISLRDANRHAAKPPVTDRSNCLNPDQCRAKGRGLCQSCVIRVKQQDPDFAAARDARIESLNSDPTFIAALSGRMKSLHRDPQFAEQTRQRGVAQMAINHADQEFLRRVEDGQRHGRYIRQMMSDHA